jgi:hypothetical protein
MNWWESEGHLVNVRVCLLPGSSKQVLHGRSMAWMSDLHCQPDLHR